MGWWLRTLGLLHAGTGVVLYRRPLAEIMQAGVVGAVPDRGDRATAFWFMTTAPLLWVGGRLLDTAVSAGDREAQRAVGAVVAVTGIAGAIAMPLSGFGAVAAAGIGAWRQARREL